MLFKETKLGGAFIIELEPIEDERGFFARSFCAKEFEQHGLNSRIVQCNVSYNRKKGTLRGMHYQVSPYEEAKLVSCMSGAIYDVIIDLRPDSPNYCKWIAVELSANDYKMFYIPENFAHGFQTLKDNTTVFYQMTEFYHPKSAKGIRWNDSAFQIKWPIIKEDIIISEKDRGYTSFKKKSVN